MSSTTTTKARIHIRLTDEERERLKKFRQFKLCDSLKKSSVREKIK